MPYVKQLCVLFLLMLSSFSQAKVENKQAIINVLNNYIEGTSEHQPEKIKSAFYAEADLFLEKSNQPIWRVAVGDYASWFSKPVKQNTPTRVGEILNIDIENNIATAKVEILQPHKSLRWVDLFLLKKLPSGWKVISKTATKEKQNINAQRVLFIVSNAHFHGDTQLPAGVSFGEIVKAFDTFKQAGYTVDFVSPEGGAIPLAYINTAIPIHKKYLYNRDFMYAIGNTRTPEQIAAKDYRAVHYIGGTNAMYGVAENKALQEISMEIYEEHNGVISSVCHGTAGIVNLKTKNGEYLVKDKIISGYPEAYENQTKAYFKEFPFLIQQTIESRGGTFKYSKRNTPHVEVDGRIVTGQNHLSSTLVAKEMIKILNKQLI